MKILVVDDIPLMRHVLINMLRALNFPDLVEATDGVQALSFLKNQDFDLVITDLHMPKFVGVSLPRSALKKDDQPSPTYLCLRWK